MCTNLAIENGGPTLQRRVARRHPYRGTASISGSGFGGFGGSGGSTFNSSLRWKSKMPATMWGPQDSVQLPYKWLNSMVYSRYNELVNRVYKPIYNWGAPLCMIENKPKHIRKPFRKHTFLAKNATTTGYWSTRLWNALNCKRFHLPLMWWPHPWVLGIFH